MKESILLLLMIAVLSACTLKEGRVAQDSILAAGQMPNLAKDGSGGLHMVYGTGDSIMYLYSLDQGKTFSKPHLISVLSGLAASHTRGPQIAATANELIVTACSKAGNIFSYIKDGSGAWTPTSKVNDVDTIAKENLMALAADGDDVFAVWLDLRDKHNKVFGARSADGGKTWSKNIQVYASPDTTVCECCKPSVLVKGSNVYVMFRNWLNGNRDMYLAQSKDGGITFGAAQKLGQGSWKLNACPMDGGALAVSEDGTVQTVWRREGTVYTNSIGAAETKIGEGHGCTLEYVNGKNIYGWTENGNVIVMEPEEQKKVLGKGSGPILKAINNDQVLCVWEQDKQIHAVTVQL